MGSASLAAAHLPAWTVTIPLQSGGLRGKKGFWQAANNRGAPEFNNLEQRLYKEWFYRKQASSYPIFLTYYDVQFTLNHTVIY